MNNTNKTTLKKNLEHAKCLLSKYINSSDSLVDELIEQRTKEAKKEK